MQRVHGILADSCYRLTRSRHGLGPRFLFSLPCICEGSAGRSAVLVGLFSSSPTMEPRPTSALPGGAFAAKAARKQRASCLLLVSPPVDLGMINSVSATKSDSELRRQKAKRTLDEGPNHLGRAACMRRRAYSALVGPSRDNAIQRRAKESRHLRAVAFVAYPSSARSPTLVPLLAPAAVKMQD